MQTRGKSCACALALLLLTVGCSSTSPLLTADPTGTALFEQGQDALVEGRWRDAITAFDILLRNYPSSPFLAESRLGLGRAHFEEGRVESLIMAVDAFQGFLTYHPSHKSVDYAQYMVAMTFIKQMRTPDRDQAPTRRAIAAMDLFIESYPESPLMGSMVRQRLAAIDSLASHELQVARWQARREYDWDAAIDRVNYALETYPETTLKCDLLFILAEAHKQGQQLEDAVLYYGQVINDYPDCVLVKEAQERLREINGI